MGYSGVHIRPAARRLRPRRLFSFSRRHIDLQRVTSALCLR
jgi:hypothetical protein